MSNAISTLLPVTYRSDFKLRLRLYTADGVELGWPSCDWRAEFYTYSTANTYVASCIGGVCTNCSKDPDGVIRVVFNNHKLLPGVLKVRFTLELPDEEYPDASEQKTILADLNVELVRSADGCQCAQDIEAEVYLSVLRDSEVAEAILAIVNKQLKAILGAEPTGFEPAPEPAPSGTQTINSGEIKILRRGIISIFAKTGVLYRNHGSIKLPMEAGTTKTFSLDGISTELFPANLWADNEEGIEYDADSNTITATRTDEGTDEGTCVVLEIKSGCDYLMRNADGQIIGVPANFANVDLPTIRPPQIEELASCIRDGVNQIDGMRLEFAQKHSVRSFVNSAYTSQGRPHYGRRSKWTKLKSNKEMELKIPRMGVFKARFHTRRGNVSPWVVFSILITKNGKLYINQI